MKFSAHKGFGEDAPAKARRFLHSIGRSIARLLHPVPCEEYRPSRMMARHGAYLKYSHLHRQHFDFHSDIN